MPLLLRAFADLVHEDLAEGALGLKLIVRAASEPQVLERGLPAAGDGLDVIEFEILQ